MKKKGSKIIAAALAAFMSVSATFTAFADVPVDGQTSAEQFAIQYNLTDEWQQWKTDWDNIRNDWTLSSMTVGADASSRNFAWYSLSPKAVFKISKSADMSQPLVNQEVTGKADDILKKGDTQYYGCKASVSGLEAGDYYYQIDNRTPEKFTVHDDKNGFSFIYVGDPQIGSSNSMKGSKIKTDEDAEKYYNAQSDAIRSDTFNWNYTLESALKKSVNASFILSAGDQIQSRKKDAPANATDTSYSEIEYTGFLSANVLKNVPLAPSVGNHDSTLGNYDYHFNVPNKSDLGSNGVVGGDYSFRQGNALFIMLNTQGASNEEHKKFIEETCKANSDAKWKFVTLHQDIYGSGEHSNEPEITNLRYELAPVFEANDIDVVFTGHDHTYSRTFVLNGGKKTNNYYDGKEDEYADIAEIDMDGGKEKDSVFTAYGTIPYNTEDAKQQEYLKYLKSVSDKQAVETTRKDKVVNPDGILYMTANSSSGSKFYDLSARKQSYVADRWQEDVPTYSVVDVTDDTFTINTYRTDTDEKIDSEFTIVKEDKTEQKHTHKLSDSYKKEPTCTESGIKTYKCECGEEFDIDVPAKGHNYVKSEVIAPTEKTEGYTIYKCPDCGATVKKDIVPKVKKPEENTTNNEEKTLISTAKITGIKNTTYTGKQIKPAIKVTSGKTVLRKGKDYTVSYGKNKIGKATVKVTGKGKYEGYVVKTFTISPRKTSVTVSSKTKGKIKAKIVKRSEAAKYQIQYSSNSKFKGAKTVTTSSMLKNISAKSKKTYYVRVRTVNGKYVSGWSAVKKIKVK